MKMPHYQVKFNIKRQPHGIIWVQIEKFAETVTEVISWVEEKYPDAKILTIIEAH